MPIYTNNYPTLIQLADEIGNGNREIINLIVGQNDGAIMGILPVKTITGLSESVTQVTQLPSGTWVDFDEYVNPNKGASKEVTFIAKMLKGFCEANADKAERHPGGVAQYILQESSSHIQGMGRDGSKSIFYGNLKKKEIQGLKGFVSAESETYIDASGSAETFSIYALKLGSNGVYLFREDGGNLVNVKPYPRRIKENSVGGKKAIYEVEYTMFLGMAVANPKAIGRITKFDSTHPLTLAMMDDLFDKMGGRPDVLVTNFRGMSQFREIKANLIQMAPETTGLNYTVNGFDGVPILIDTNLRNDEGAI